MSDYKQGLLAGVGAYLLWGLLPIYWKLVESVPATEVLAFRIIWSFIFLVVLFIFMRKLPQLHDDIRYIVTHPKIIVGISLSALLISANWIIFIWSVANERMVEVSLGYYINPLLNVVLGVLFFKETLLKKQWLAIGLATLGVLVLTLSFGQIPYLALTLALTFGLYGLVKKQTKLSSMTGLIIETLLLMPIALAFIMIVHPSLSSALYLQNGLSYAILLAGTGVATAIPLILFGFSAQRIPFSLLGLLQYVAPTIMLGLGVLLYGEPFTIYHTIAFLCIWIALGMYSLSRKSTSLKHVNKPLKEGTSN
ncbi:EamA family transporter RarD [Paenalkalicoccus suaedae]|uniref:EamA family transporter RarD n=1 Tax=Paenalkalicoccus suaedae TaxID=2592382 RepID=A0A859FEM9_9BACI|nr:EamA family transporter RarD [Paenalkalicoccus suaedae]QKS71629.1 EamA family transporter RarD [Paenalkalicoccus suaedae]